MWFRGPKADVIEFKMSLSPAESWPLCLPAALVNEFAAKGVGSRAGTSSYGLHISLEQGIWLQCMNLEFPSLYRT